VRLPCLLIVPGIWVHSIPSAVMHLGLGAAVENLVLAARAFGLAADVEPAGGALVLSPNDTPVAAAKVTLTPTPPFRNALFDAIPNRHTNRGPYRADQSVGSERLGRLADLTANDAVRVVFVEDAHARGELAALIVEATERIISDSQMSADSARWFRMGRRDIEAHHDGVTIDTAGLSPLMTATAKLLPDMDAKSADRYWLSMTRDTQLASAPLLGVILVRDRLDMNLAMEAGRAWQRLHLGATAEGSPLNRSISPSSAPTAAQWSEKMTVSGGQSSSSLPRRGGSRLSSFAWGSLNGRRVRARDGR
jgi:hypothetical protein